jgi:NADH dehydrogenase (ubiquinone) Fe-S protein 4
MFQLSTRRFSVVASGVKSRASASVRCFSATENSDAVVEVKKKIPTYNDPIATVDIKSLSLEEQVKLAEYKAEKTRVLTRKSAKPRELTDYAVGDYEPLPENPAELAALSGMPAEHQDRTVIIRNRYSTSFSSGDSYAHQWQISWKQSDKWSNPLTGWTSGADPLAYLTLYFDTREEAIQHAERNGWKYEVKGEVSDDVMELGWRAYEHNFLSQRVRKIIASESKKPTHFQNPHYGKSGWFMPLKYHGDGEVVQHGE